jgi:cell filamentation protein
MSRYDNATGAEGEYEPSSHGRVLRNLAGIRVVKAMQLAEYESLRRAQQEYVDVVENTTRFKAALLCDMHRDWLGKLYPWAGRYRQVEMAKGGFRWPPAMLVGQNMAMFESGLLHECTPCRPGSLKDVAEQITKVHAELLLIHPFREGNGRLARWLADLMAGQATLPAPHYGFEGSGSMSRRKWYLNGVIRGYGKDYVALRDFFVDALERGLRTIF